MVQRKGTILEGFTPPVSLGLEGWDIPVADSWKYFKIQNKTQTEPRTPCISCVVLAQQENVIEENIYFYKTPESSVES